MWKLLFWSIFLIVGGASSARADLIPMSPELKDFLMQPEQKNAVIGTMFGQWQAIIENCPSPQLTQTNVIIEKPPTFDRNGAPTSGVWRVIGRVEGCGEQRLFSVLQGVTSDGKVGKFALLPGTTAADPKLQRDAIFYAIMGMAAIAPKECKDAKISDTKFLQFGEESPEAAPGHNSRTWDEEWTVKSCGVTGIVPMKFIPDATGTTIRSFVNGTRQISP